MFFLKKKNCFSCGKKTFILERCKECLIQLKEISNHFIVYKERIKNLEEEILRLKSNLLYKEEELIICNKNNEKDKK